MSICLGSASVTDTLAQDPRHPTFAGLRWQMFNKGHLLKGSYGIKVCVARINHVKTEIKNNRLYFCMTLSSGEHKKTQLGQ